MDSCGGDGCHELLRPGRNRGPAGPSPTEDARVSYPNLKREQGPPRTSRNEALPVPFLAGCRAWVCKMDMS